MLPLSRSWSIPLIIYGSLFVLPGMVMRFIQLFNGGLSSAFADSILQNAIDIGTLTIGAMMIWYGIKLRSNKNGSESLTGIKVRGGLFRARANFYFGIALFIFPFFLLHWNGLFSFTYYWYLRRIGGEHEFEPQILAALGSTLVICTLIVIIFELAIRKKYNNRSGTPS